MTYQKTLTRIIEEVVAPGAAEVDRSGSFPRAAVDALADGGLLALTVPAEQGGGGAGPRVGADVVRQLSTACGSTAMVVMMHYSAVAVLAACERGEPLRDIVSGRHLSTIAFSEAGSRSHFWAPLGTSTMVAGEVRLDARKSWVTSAREAQTYVWSSLPLAATGPMTLWLVPADAPGLSAPGDFDGLGLRGNGSRPVSADGVRVPRAAMLGDDGVGLDLALSSVLPWFLLLNASASIGLMQAVTRETVEHLERTRLEHLDATLSGQPGARAVVARMHLDAARTQALVRDACTALEEGRPEAQVLVLATKAAADESAAAVADLAMKVCGGAAFRRELGVERRFRDSRAARVMAPTTDALLEFIGRALCGLPMLGGGVQ